MPFAMAKSDELSTDWQRSAGDFSCTICQRKRLPASEFSKAQVQKALDALKNIPDKDIRSDVQHVHFVSAICKSCMEEREAKEREEAQARREEKAKEIEEGAAAMGAPEVVVVTLKDRPFGMTPSKADNVGYLVVKTSEGKPAATAGVRPGWRVVNVAGSECKDLDMEATQSLLKGADLPAAVSFETVPSGADFCTACCKVLPEPAFSRKMRTRPPDKRRCSACVEAMDAVEAEGKAEREAAAASAGGAAASGASGKSSGLAELRELCAATAREAEVVTGLKAVKGGSAKGRGRGRR